MAKIGFIGIGNMGAHMARNLIKAGHEVTAFDLFAPALEAIAQEGATIAPSAAVAVQQAQIVITMLPEGKHVFSVYNEAVFGNAPENAILIDCSTIDIETCRHVSARAASRGYEMLDAPVSGGVIGAQQGTLTFMIGGSKDALHSTRSIFDCMGKNTVYCGGAGAGQAAKVCNNMMVGIQMISVAEGFNLAEALGLDHQVLFDVASISSGQCWALTTNCPVPGPVPTSPANRGYKGGFAASLMLKDMNLAVDAGVQGSVSLKIAQAAADLYADLCEKGFDKKDFSSIIEMLRDR